MKAFDLVGGQDISDLRSYSRFESDLVGLSRRQLVRSPPHRGLVVVRMHDLAIELPPRFPKPSAGRDPLFLVIASDLLHSLVLVWSETDCAHQPLLELLALCRSELGPGRSLTRASIVYPGPAG